VGEAQLFQPTEESLNEDIFVSAIERLYKDSRLLAASVASSSRINRLLYTSLWWLWALAVAIAFSVLWSGERIALWLIPSVSVLGGVVVIFGRAPTDILSGAVYAMFTRPFDIGDRVTLSQPGCDPVLYPLLVREIDGLRTHFITASCELLLVENHALRALSVVNLSRSPATCLRVPVQVPVSTPASQMTGLVDAVQQYCAEAVVDWLPGGVEAQFASTDFAQGHMNLNLWVTCRHPPADVNAVYGARSALLLFVHAYMESSGIEYIKPLAPIQWRDGGASGQPPPASRVPSQLPRSSERGNRVDGTTDATLGEQDRGSISFSWWGRNL